MLRRWRERSLAPTAIAKGITFEGCRMMPGTFQLLEACRTTGLQLDASLTAETLRPYYERARREHPTWRAPNPIDLAAVVTCLAKTNRLLRVLGRERSTENPGLPDLTLWQRNRDGVPFGGRFIEVKRRTQTYKEPVSKEQRAEIEFLKDLGAKADVIYLLHR